VRSLRDIASAVLDPDIAGSAVAVPAPTNNGRSANPLRPDRLDSMIGQDRTKALMRRVIDATLKRRQPLDHVLLVGPSGTGKSTLANVIANELGADCYQVEAPVSHETLLALREVMRDGDVLFIDEIHQQAIAERRGRSTSTQPEVLYHVLEDRTIVTGTGVLPFPAITVIGATTDEGMLPDAFVNRFPLRPVLERYEPMDLVRIAKANADVLGVGITPEAAVAFALASRAVPRQVNNYVRNGAMLGEAIDEALAREVVGDLNRTTEDGLTHDMARALVHVFTKGRRTNGKGVTTYQASVATIATAIGKSRDTKAVQLRVEPYLIEQGYLQVGHGGRSLTDAGIARASELVQAGVA
jgi:Holliday junction DNA helicase RuvB